MFQFVFKQVPWLGLNNADSNGGWRLETRPVLYWREVVKVVYGERNYSESNLLCIKHAKRRIPQRNISVLMSMNG